jgi:hypothetical protein
MDDLRVIAPMGLTLHGPITLRLTKEQFARRPHIEKPERGLKVDLPIGATITFKQGETFGVNQADLPKVAVAAVEFKSGGAVELALEAPEAAGSDAD